MRNPKRIPICIELFKTKKVLMNFLNNNKEVFDIITPRWGIIIKTWKENPDLRFGQLLCTLRFIPTLEIENHIWNIEETTWLVQNGYCNYEDINFWGSVFFKNGNPRKQVKHTLLKDLTTTHIKNIIKWFGEDWETRLQPPYVRYFKKRIYEL